MTNNVTIDQVFAWSRSTADTANNRAAMCAACNTQKWKLDEGKLNYAALAALRENGREQQANFLENLSRRGTPLSSEANLATAQTTMFGAKLVSGALAEILIGDLARPENAEKKRRLFPAQRASDLALARERWFCNMDRQKRALRAPKSGLGNGELLQVGDDPKQIDGALQDPEKCPDWIRILPKGKLEIIPNQARVETVWLKCEQHVPLALKAGNEAEINLQAKKIQGRLAAINGQTDGDQWPLEVLSRRDGILRVRAFQTATCELRFEGQPFNVVIQPRKEDPICEYHHAMDAIVAAANADWHTIACLSAAQQRSKKAASVFEQALADARPLDSSGNPLPDAAPAHRDWLIHKPVFESGVRRSKTNREPLGFWKDPNIPQAPEVLTQRHRLDRIPRRKIDSIIEAAAEVRDALKHAWAEIDALPDGERERFINTEGRGDNRQLFITAEWFLEKRREAWAQINALPPAERARNIRIHTDHNGRETEIIRVSWFREDWRNRATLFLDPLRVRSVPLSLSGRTDSANSQRMNPRDRGFAIARRGHLHYFNRKECWSQVILWQTPDGKTGYTRRRPRFYRRKHGSSLPLHANREWETENHNGEWVEKTPPPEAEILATFYRGAKVRIVEGKEPEGEYQFWRVKCLDKRGAKIVAWTETEQNVPAEGEVKSLSKVYRALRLA